MWNPLPALGSSSPSYYYYTLRLVEARAGNPTNVGKAILLVKFRITMDSRYMEK